MHEKLLSGLAVCGVLLVGSLAVAQSPRKPKAKETPLIDSIQGPALSKAYCASCHSADGKGDGPMARSLKVKPADLTRIAARNGGTFPLMSRPLNQLSAPLIRTSSAGSGSLDRIQAEYLTSERQPLAHIEAVNVRSESVNWWLAG